MCTRTLQAAGRGTTRSSVSQPHTVNTNPESEALPNALLGKGELINRVTSCYCWFYKLLLLKIQSSIRFIALHSPSFVSLKARAHHRAEQYLQGVMLINWYWERPDCSCENVIVSNRASGGERHYIGSCKCVFSLHTRSHYFRYEFSTCFLPTFILCGSWLFKIICLPWTHPMA